MLGVVVALVAVTAALAGGGSEAVRLSDHPGGVAASPAAAANRAGGLVVWEAHLGDPSRAAEDEIFGRLVGPRGRPDGPQRRLTSFGPAGARAHRAHSPAVSFDLKRRRYLLAWVGTQPSRREVWVQLLDDRGRPSSRSRRITGFGAEPSGASAPRLAYNLHRREWLVAYAGTAKDGTSGVFTRRVDARGRPAGPQREPVPAAAVAAGPVPSLAYDSRRRGFLLAYAVHDRIQDGRIEVRRLDSLGRSDGPARVLFVEDARRADSPALAYDAQSSRFAVIWEAPRVDRPYGPPRAALVDGAGRRMRGLSLDLPADAETRNPAVAANGDGGFLATWTWKVTGEHGRDLHEEIYGRAFSAGGAPRTPTRRISFMGRGRRTGQVCHASGSAAIPLGRDYLAAFDGQDCGPAGPEVFAARVRLP